MRGVEYRQSRAFENSSNIGMESPNMAGTEGADSPTSVSTTRGPTTVTEMPAKDKNSEHELTHSAAVLNKRSPPTMDEASPRPKRPKPLSIPISPLNEPLTPQNMSVSDASEAISSEDRFSDHCKRLADLYKILSEKEKELAAMKKEIEDHKRCVNEVLECIRQEILGK